MDTKGSKKNKSKGGVTRNTQTVPERNKSVIKCPSCQTENSSDSRFCSNCAASLKDSITKTIKSPTFEVSRGDLFAARYEVIEALGQGGMGKVFKVYDRKIGEVVVLKLIRPEIGVNERAIERFKNELKIARKITHRNICRMYDLGEEGFFHYITMEFVAGEDLKRFIRRAGPLTSGKTIDIAKQVVEGLAEAHRLGVIHRDLKPQNIMIDQDGNAKIMDFGIARFVDTERMTGSGVMIGTPEYMSPEQAELKEVDKRADFYSLGVVLYEMVSGRVPFEGATPLSVAMKHKTEKPRNVRELNAQVSLGLARIISKCMEKACDKRYQSAEEILDALNSVEQELSTAERFLPKKEMVSGRKAARKSPAAKLILTAAAVIVIALAVLVVDKYLLQKGSTPPVVQTGNALAAKAAPEQVKIPPSVSAEKKPEVKAEEKQEIKPGIIEDKTREAAASAAVKKDEPQPSAIPSKTGASDADLESARLSIARMNAARVSAQKQGVNEKTLFFRLADAKAQEAIRSLSQNNLVDSRSQSFVTEKLYWICAEKDKDEDRLKALKNFVEDLRGNVEDARLSSPGDKILDSAKENEKQGVALYAKKDIENSAKAYVQASVIYKKILLSPKTTKNK